MVDRVYAALACMHLLEQAPALLEKDSLRLAHAALLAAAPCVLRPCAAAGVKATLDVTCQLSHLPLLS